MTIEPALPELEFFTRDELVRTFSCSHTGILEADWDFLIRLDELRRRCGFSFQITSGYRHPTHPREIGKATRSGQHTYGWAADIFCTDSARRHTIVDQALKMNFAGIGIAKTFVHVDDRRTTPRIWSY